MSAKTSTAALDSFRPTPFRDPRRVPRHPAGARNPALQRSEQDGDARQQQFQQAKIVIHREGIMNARSQTYAVRDIRTIFPVILRITLSILLWTLGAASMNLAASEVNEHRVVKNFSLDRAKVEHLQRWVNAGHDSWCRDPQLVAAAALRRVAPDLAGYEPASLSLELERSRKTSAVYTFHSLDGRTAYRVALRRHRWLLPIAGSLQQTIWIPERVEIFTRTLS